MKITQAEVDMIKRIMPGEYGIYRIDGKRVETLGTSPQIHRLNGMEREEYCLLTGEDALLSVYPEDRPELTEKIARSIEAEEPLDYFYRTIHKQRGFDWVHITGTYCGDLDGLPVMLVVYSNASVESNLYQAILDRLHDMVYVCDCRTFQILYANAAARAYIGSTEAELLGRRCYEGIRGKKAPCADCFLNTIKPGDFLSETHFDARSGGWEHLSGEYIDWCGHEAFVQYIHDITQEKKNELKQKKLAETDVLTGLNNRGAAERRICEALGQDEGARCALLMIDLDDLKGINDRLGHASGDAALRGLADALRDHFRSTDIIGRVGGDEFIVLLRDIAGAATLRSTMNSFMEKLAQRRVGKKHFLGLHCSIGCAFGVCGRDDYQTLYRHADRALYYVKNNGKNDYAFYVQEMERKDYRYLPHSGISITHTEWYDTGEYKKLLKALVRVFPLVISANLTQNSYYMMEYDTFATHKSPESGTYDYLIETGAPTFAPEDRQSFIDSFDRERMLAAYREGRTMISQVGMQAGDDGVYRRVRTIAVIIPDETTGDICEISISCAAEDMPPVSIG